MLHILEDPVWRRNGRLCSESRGQICQVLGALRRGGEWGARFHGLGLDNELTRTVEGVEEIGY